MGIDTKAIIRSGVKIQQIAEVIEKHYKNVEIVRSADPSIFRVKFDDNKDRRMLWVMYDSVNESDPIDGVLLSLGCHGSSIEIMKTILKEFGGYLDENDCDGIGYYPIEAENKNQPEPTELEKLKHDAVDLFAF